MRHVSHAVIHRMSDIPESDVAGAIKDSRGIKIGTIYRRDIGIGSPRGGEISDNGGRKNKPTSTDLGATNSSFPYATFLPHMARAS